MLRWIHRRIKKVCSAYFKFRYSDIQRKEWKNHEKFADFKLKNTDQTASCKNYKQNNFI